MDENLTTGELKWDSDIKDSLITATDGKRTVLNESTMLKLAPTFEI